MDLKNILSHRNIFSNVNVVFLENYGFKTMVVENKPAIAVIDMKTKLHVKYSHYRMFLTNKEQTDFVEYVLTNYKQDILEKGLFDQGLYNSVLQKYRLAS